MNANLDHTRASGRRTWRNRAIGLVVAVAVLAPVTSIAGAGAANAAAYAPNKVPARGVCPFVPAGDDDPATDDLMQPGGLYANANADFSWRQFTGSDAWFKQEFQNNGRSLYRSLTNIGANRYYEAGAFGQGIDVALIDTGVANVPGLDNGNVVNALDISFDANDADSSFRDPVGHGTHLASIIAGRDDPSAVDKGQGKYSWRDYKKFTGVAPGARVVNVKVGDSSGAVDNTQIAASIDWIRKHAKDKPTPENPKGFNIRVINLAFGIDAAAITSEKDDPISMAVDQAWRDGIVVIASTGNQGKKQQQGMSSPAFNPNIIAVGAWDPVTNTVPDFSTASVNFTRTPDFVAPGQSVIGLHAPASVAADQIVDDCMTTTRGTDAVAPAEWNSPVIGSRGRFVRGSGTSQAAAYTSGAVALMLSQKPWLTPDQVKYLLRTTAKGDVGQGVNVNGQGSLSLSRAFDRDVSTSYVQTKVNIVGGGSWDLSRGNEFLWDGTTRRRETYPGLCDSTSANYAQFVAWGLDPKLFCVDEPVELRGNKDIFGNTVDPAALAAAEKAGPKAAWPTNPDGTESWFNGSFTLSGKWTVDPELGPTWKAVDWEFNSTTAFDWTGKRWVGKRWVGKRWVGKRWVGEDWVGKRWVGKRWVGKRWVDGAWADAGWS